MNKERLKLRSALYGLTGVVYNGRALYRMINVIMTLAKAMEFEKGRNGPDQARLRKRAKANLASKIEQPDGGRDEK